MHGLKIGLLWTWCVAFTVIYKLLTFVLLTVPGYALTALAIRKSVFRPSRITPSLMIVTAPRWLHLWGNEQEGYDAPKSFELWPKASTFKRRWLWAARRNPVGNLRFTMRWLHQPLRIPRVWACSSNLSWYIMGQGWRLGWFWDRPAKRSFTKIGFRYGPQPIPDGQDDWRQFGTGLAWRPRAHY
jgi:hypothetical protein